MNNITQLITDKLAERERNDSLRRLTVNEGLIDFSSNDYLGFARSAALRQAIDKALQEYPDHRSGSTGSRLLCGNDAFTESLEQDIAAFHGASAGLIFNSGYDANIGLFSALLQRGDTLIADELIHASVIDGVRMSFATRFSFRHNDLDDLEAKLKTAHGRRVIAVESIYSMDGDTAPLAQIADLAAKYDAALIVDEAHATGIFGDRGRGLVNALRLENKVFARIVTFGKALGTHGAIVLGSNDLRLFLVNFARSFIYSTAAPFHTHLSIKMAYAELQRNDHPAIIQRTIGRFNALADVTGLPFIPSSSAIQCVVIGGNERTRRVSAGLRNAGIDARPILHPTVPVGKERLRICLHSFNTDTELELLVMHLNRLLT